MRRKLTPEERARMAARRAQADEWVREAKEIVDRMGARIEARRRQQEGEKPAP